MIDWRHVGIVMDGQSILVDGLNPWAHEWKPTDDRAFEVPHPSYPDQRHWMYIYEIIHGTKTITFAAGELSANVWSFYVPNDQVNGV
jgi:hypothetical protein